MPDITHQFHVKAPAQKVFQAVSSPEGIAKWWTKRSSGQARFGGEYELWFGPDYDWRALVSRYVPGREFELKLVRTHEDWVETKVGFLLDESGGATKVCFQHIGWRELNEHYRISCFCWALYLRLLKRYVERGETVPYESRLEA